MRLRRSGDRQADAASQPGLQPVHGHTPSVLPDDDLEQPGAEPPMGRWADRRPIPLAPMQADHLFALLLLDSTGE